MKIKKLKVTFRGFEPETMKEVEKNFEMHVPKDVPMGSPKIQQIVELEYWNWLLANAYYPDWDGALSYGEK
jgi:hypothetical protein